MRIEKNLITALKNYSGPVEKKINLHKTHFYKTRHIMLLYIFIGLIQSCASFLIPVSIGEFFSIHFHSGSTKGRLLQLLGIHFQTLTSFFLFFGLLLLIKTIFEFWERWLSYQQGELYVKAVREKIFETQIGWSSDQFKQKHFGKYLLRYSNDMKSLQNYLTKGIMGFIKDIFFLAMGFFLLWMIHPQLDVYLLLLTSVIMAAIFTLSGFQKKLIVESRIKRSNLLAFVAKIFHRHTSMKEKNTEIISQKRFDGISSELFAANMLNNAFDSMLQALLPLFQFLMIGILLWLITLPVIAIDRNDALVFVLITLMMLSPMKRILKVPAVRNKGKISIEKINEILNSSSNTMEIEAALITTDR